jgi:hypothetical protein
LEITNKKLSLFPFNQSFGDLEVLALFLDLYLFA